MNFLSKALEITKNPYATIVSDGIGTADVDEYTDTGSYIFNALLSGDIYGGLPSNKITVFAGATSTGKTYFTLGVVDRFLTSNPKGNVIYFESESAVTKSMFDIREIDTDRVLIIPSTTIEEFRIACVKILDNYVEQKEKIPLLLCLDSLGMLSTEKEVSDMSEGSNVRDMGRAGLIKGTVRVLTLKLAKAGIPMIITNHLYTNIGGYGEADQMSGGKGLYYAASGIVMLTRRKEKEGREVVGHVITCKNYKSRLTVENKSVEVLLTYKDGLDRYYGLLDMAEKYNIVKKLGNRYEWSDGTKHYAKSIYKEPDKFFTDDILDGINDACKQEFLYGGFSEYESKEEQLGETVDG